MGIVVLVAVRIRVKGLPSSLFSARYQSVQFMFLAVFVLLITSTKKLNLHMSWRRLRDLSVSAKNTSIGFKMGDKPKLESDCFSVS